VNFVPWWPSYPTENCISQWSVVLCLTSGGSLPQTFFPLRSLKPNTQKNQKSETESSTVLLEPSDAVAGELELESADYFTSFAQMMGFPKSVGQIYGLLFMSVEPIPMEAVMTRLGISKGSASQGLNLLKDLGAVQSIRVSGDRREHFEADFDVSRMIHHFIGEKLKPRIQHGEERLEKMSDLISQMPEESSVRMSAEGRLKALRKWQNRGKGVLPLIQRFFGKNE
jgi:DNA-binding transcriptional regulator GbsR (MarR family)